MSKVLLLPVDEKAHQKSSEADEQPARKNDHNKQQDCEWVGVDQPGHEPEEAYRKHRPEEGAPDGYSVKVGVLFAAVRVHKQLIICALPGSLVWRMA